MKIGLTHPLIALATQLVLFGLFGNWWLGVIAAGAFYCSREIAQAEYRWIETYGHGLRANMPWWGGFDPRVWDRHSLTDCLIPLAVTIAAALVGNAL